MAPIILVAPISQIMAGHDQVRKITGPCAKLHPLFEVAVVKATRSRSAIEADQNGVLAETFAGDQQDYARPNARPRTFLSSQIAELNSITG